MTRHRFQISTANLTVREMDFTPNQLESGGLKCSCVVENVNDTGQVLRRKVCKSAVLDLGRNEVADVVLKLSHTEGIHGPFVIREHVIHKRFLKDGKVTVVLVPQKIHFLISNCPPSHLKAFIQSMFFKVRARGKIQGSHRRMLGDISLKFNEISPLNAKDIEMAKKNDSSKPPGDGGRAKSKENTMTPNRKKTSKLKPQKRDFSEVNSSNGTTSSHSTFQPAKKRALLKPLSSSSSSSSSSSLSAEQAKILLLVKNGYSVFFTGSAGTGKSHLLKQIINSLPPDTTFPTASTGAAACLIGGTTLHAFAGVGTGNGTLDRCIAMASRDAHAPTWKKCRCLIIDEISMVDADFFDKIEAVARAVRRSKDTFGGIQLVVCGDFLQLPPVSKDGEKKRHCFQAKCWHACISRSIELTEIYRQNDKQFIALLQNIRIGRCTPTISRILASTQTQDIERNGIRTTKLCTHKEDVQAINLRELGVLGGSLRKFLAQDSDPQMGKTLDIMCPVEQTVELKVGAQVMLTKNIDVHRNLVNGARGVIKSFDSSKGQPVVRFACGLEETVGPEKWSVRSGGGTFATRRQLPLKLAWAISIHKSQGMTLDCVEMSLGRCFEAGQAYVALSRAKNLQSLRVKDFQPSCVRAHPDVLDFYRILRRTRRNYIENELD